MQSVQLIIPHDEHGLGVLVRDALLGLALLDLAARCLRVATLRGVHVASAGDRGKVVEATQTLFQALFGI